eukprot:scaffold10953_cov120-Isochrysis_galbana.AAC.1
MPDAASCARQRHGSVPGRRYLNLAGTSLWADTWHVTHLVANGTTVDSPPPFPRLSSRVPGRWPLQVP